MDCKTDRRTEGGDTVADLISRQAALTALLTSQTFQDVHDALERLPAVDAVQVVRCRDCRFFKVKELWSDFWGNSERIPILIDHVPTCHRWDGEHKTSLDGYCFLGERRT